MNEAVGQRTYRATVEAVQAAAGRIARALDETEGPETLAVSYFELRDGLFEVSALFDGSPDEQSLRTLIEEAAGDEPVSPLRIEALPDENWVMVSQGQRAPIQAGRFLIHGSHDRDNVARNRFTIEIDADQAFGTAHHATTRGCLMAIDDLAKRGRPDLVADLGAGTGILAIAAAKAFDRPVVAADNDPVAVKIATDNVRKAGLGQQVHVIAADGLSDPVFQRLKPDLIIANILAGPLNALAPAMARTVQPGGYVLLSGLTANQAAPLIARYCSLGFVLERRIVLDTWATLLFGRRPKRFVRLIGGDASAYKSCHVPSVR